MNTTEFEKDVNVCQWLHSSSRNPFLRAHLALLHNTSHTRINICYLTVEVEEDAS